MKKFIALFAFLTNAVLSVQSAAQVTTAPAPEETLLPNKIYFFAHSMCRPCRQTFIYFDQHHADLDIPITDMKFPHNLELYKQCVAKFGIKNSELTLPLICMGDNYIMGWTAEDERRFEQYLKEFQPQINN